MGQHVPLFRSPVRREASLLKRCSAQPSRRSMNRDYDPSAQTKERCPIFVRRKKIGREHLMRIQLDILMEFRRAICFALEIHTFHELCRFSVSVV
jgi:hypothetical protein